MIATFPEFSTLNLDSLSEIKQFVSLLPSYTEFNFTDMFVWDVMHPVMISMINGNLVAKFTDVRTDEYYYSLLGTNKINQSIHDIFELSLSEGRIPIMRTVPQIVIEHLQDDEDIEVEEDDTNHDYILSVADLAEFKSEKFSDKRNMVNRFYSRHPNHRVEELDLSEKKNADQVRKVLQKWENKLGMDAHEIIVEFTAIEKAIIHSKELGIRCFATYVDDEIEAFTIFEHLDERNVVMHFEKANRKISGIYEHQKHNLAKHLHAQGIETINYGQDLGYEGLRKSKMSYHPVRFHKKYSLKHKKAQNFTPKHQPNKRTSSHAKHANTVHHSPHKTHTTA